MSIKIRERDNVSILDIEGRVDINSAEIIESVGWLVNSGKLNIVMNFEGVDIVDYHGISILAVAYKNITNHSGKLRLTGVSVSIREMLKVAKLDNVFELYADEDAAVRSFFLSEVERLRLRRRFHRLDIHIGVMYKPASAAKDDKSFGGNVLNISAAGLYIYSPRIFPINTMLSLEFSIPGSDESLTATGRVSWLSDKELQPHYYPGMGVSFSHLTADKERCIADFIDKNVTHRTDSSE